MFSITLFQIYRDVKIPRMQSYFRTIHVFVCQLSYRSGTLDKAYVCLLKKEHFDTFIIYLIYIRK